MRRVVTEITIEDIRDTFDLKISDAAAKLGCCVSYIKIVMRKNGYSRWPYRKINSVKKMEFLLGNETQKYSMMIKQDPNIPLKSIFKKSKVRRYNISYSEIESAAVILNSIKYDKNYTPL